jgi:hypothetical protein
MPLRITMKFSIISLLLAASLGAQSSPNFSQISHVHYPAGTCGDVFAEGDRAFVGRWSEGFEILDLSNPASPQVVFSGRGDLVVQDVKGYGDLLICSNESGNGQAIILFDITNPAQPVEIGSFGGIDMQACANFDRLGTTLYCTSYTSNRIVLLDIANPAQPIQVGTIAPLALASLIHDVFVVGDRLYSTWLTGGFEVHALSPNPQSPTRILSQQIPGSLVHGLWPLATGHHVASTEGVSGGHLRIWDITNPAAPVQTAMWRADPVTMVHNVVILGDLAYVTNFSEGLRVLSLMDPSNPVELGFFDTVIGVNPFPSGVWHVHPRKHDVLIGDLTEGLYILDFTPIEISLSAVQSSVLWGQTIVLNLGADSTPVTAPLHTHVDLSFSIIQVGPQSAPLLDFHMLMPPGLVVGAPYPIPLPSGNFGGPFDVVFTLTLRGHGSFVALDSVTTTVTIN